MKDRLLYWLKCFCYNAYNIKFKSKHLFLIDFIIKFFYIADLMMEYKIVENYLFLFRERSLLHMFTLCTLNDLYFILSMYKEET